MTKNDEAAIKSIKVILSDPRWELRSFEKIKERFMGTSDDELRRLLIAAGATSKKSSDGKELWSLEAQMTEGPQSTDQVDKIVADATTAVKKEMYKRFAVGVVSGVLGLVVLSALGAWQLLLPALKSQIGGVPSGAVLAFDRQPSNPCPEGWRRFKETTSRVIVGAGNSNDVNEEKYALAENGQPLTPRAYREHGGEEAVRLTEEQMPVHSHQVIDPGHDHSITLERTNFGEYAGYFWTRRELSQGARRKDFRVGKSPANISLNDAGGSGPHNNMPPYIALYFCKKN